MPFVFDFQFLHRFDERSDETLVIHGHHPVLIGADEFGKLLFNFLRDDPDLFALGRVGIFPVVGHASDLGYLVERTGYRHDVFFQSFVRTREQGVAGVYVAAARPVEVESVTGGGIDVEIRRRGSGDASLRTDASVHVQFLGRGGIADSHVSVRQDGHVRNPSYAVVAREIYLAGASVDRTRTDVHPSAAVVRSGHGVRAVKVHESASVARGLVRYEQEPGRGAAPPVPSREGPVHGYVSRDVQLIRRRGGSSNAYDVVGKIQKGKFSVERLERRNHFVPFSGRQVRGRRSRRRKGRNVPGISGGKHAEGSEERRCPENGRFDSGDDHIFDVCDNVPILRVFPPSTRKPPLRTVFLRIG